MYTIDRTVAAGGRTQLLHALGAAAYRSGLYERARRGYERSGVRLARLVVHDARSRIAERRLRRDGGWLNTPHGARLSLDPGDRRAQELVLARGAMDPALLRVWSSLVDTTVPDVVIDVGANYGEVVLSRGYPAGCEVLALEPNPHVAAHLVRSVTAAGAAVRVLEIAASDADGVAVLHVSTATSGTSSLEATSDSHDVEVPAARLDTILGTRSGAGVLVKIDVEGHEQQVLDGLAGTIAAAERFTAVCEYAHLGADVIADLHTRFDVWLVNRYTLAMERSTVAAMTSLVERGRTDPYLKDAVLVPGGHPVPTA